MTTRPIRTIPTYRRTANQFARNKTATDRVLQEVAVQAPGTIGSLLVGLFGSAADKAAGQIIEDYAEKIRQAINEEVLEGVLFEVEIYRERATGAPGTYRVRLVRAGASAQDALERDIYLLEQQDSLVAAGPDLERFQYSNNESYFVFVSNDEDGALSAVRINNPQMLRHIAQAEVMVGGGMERRQILESAQTIKEYRAKIKWAQDDQPNELVRIQVESLARRRIAIEHRLMEARSLLNRAREERRAASRLSEIAGVLRTGASALNFGEGIAENFGSEPVGAAFGEWSTEYGPQLDLEYNFNPEILSVPQIEDTIRGLEIDARGIDLILSQND